MWRFVQGSSLGASIAAGVAWMLALAGCGSRGAELAAPASDSAGKAVISPVSNSRVAAIVHGEGAESGRVWIPAGECTMGGHDPLARGDESPRDKVILDGFWMDETEVTNARFRAFLEATHYVTTAEMKPDWEEMKKQLPAGTEKPPDEMLEPGALVFTPPSAPVPPDSVANWWTWVSSASWRHPGGPNTSIEGQDAMPVVQRIVAPSASPRGQGSTSAVGVEVGRELASVSASFGRAARGLQVGGERFLMGLLLAWQSAAAPARSNAAAAGRQAT